MPSRIGEKIGSYELIQFLGRGQIAEVYLGKHLELPQQMAAIKILDKQLITAKSHQFQKEASILVNFRHPSIVQMYDYNLYSNEMTTTLVPYIIMEYAPNKSLRVKHPRGQPLPTRTIMTYTRQIADALQYAHDQGVMHLDVKPENILINAQQKLLLSDFNLATLLTEEEKTDDIQGTPSYMSPERLEGKSGFACDQYSLGVMVYEWVCGHLPFSGQSMGEIITKHLQAPPPSLRAQVPSLSLQTEEVIFRALEKRATDRFPSIEEFAEALDKAMSFVSTSFLSFLPPAKPILPVSSKPITQSLSEPTVTFKPKFPGEVDNAFSSTNPFFREGPPADSQQSLLGDLFNTTLVQEDSQPAPVPTVEKKTSFSKIAKEPHPIFLDHLAIGSLEDPLLKSLDPHQTIYINYSREDSSTARWIERQLYAAGYSTLFLNWRIRPDLHFDSRKHKFIKQIKCMIVVLTPNYLKEFQSQRAIIDTFALITNNNFERILLVCAQLLPRKPSRLFAVFDYVDIAGKEEALAAEHLLEAIQEKTAWIFFAKTARTSRVSEPSESTSRNESSIMFSRTIITSRLIREIDVAYIEQNWQAIIEKVGYFEKVLPDKLSAKLYQMQSQAFHKKGSIHKASESISKALALVNNHRERLALLKEQVVMLTSTGPIWAWDEVQNIIDEGLRLAPQDEYWQILQQRSLLHIEMSTQNANEPLKSNDASSKPGRRVFFSYSSADELMFLKLLVSLKPLIRDHSIREWHYGDMEAGQVWSQEIKSQLDQAEIILVLLSPDSIASDFCFDVEMQRALERHHNKEATVVPVILRPCGWQQTDFRNLMALPKGAQPITRWPDTDEAFTNVMEGIRTVLEKLNVTNN